MCCTHSLLLARWKKAVERMESGQAVSKEDMQLQEAKLVKRVVNYIFAANR